MTLKAGRALTGDPCDREGSRVTLTRDQLRPGLVLLRVPSLSFERASARYRPAGALRDAPILREALAVAAPGLYARWLELGGGGGDGLSAAMARYLVRMSSRPTPFGFFATVSLGSVGEHTRLQLAPVGEATRTSGSTWRYSSLRRGRSPSMSR